MKTRWAVIEYSIGMRLKLPAELGLYAGDKVVIEYSTTSHPTIMKTTRFLESREIFKFVKYDIFNSEQYDAFCKLDSRRKYF